MKLVDILARELKVWPEGVVTAVQDLDGEVKFDNSHGMPRINSSKDVWIRQGDQGDSLYPKDLAEDCSDAIVTRTQWQAAVDALKADKVCDHYFSGTCSTCVKCGHDHSEDDVEWNGEGLPPVGTVCEMINGLGIWRQVEIFAHFKGNAFGWDGGELVNYISNKSSEFRPIRTPEQIAAEDRLKNIADALTATSKVVDPWNVDINCSSAIRATVEAMIDAGYRKFEIVDN